MIDVHSFCLDVKKRTEIEDYVGEKIGKCKHGSKCLSIQDHSRKRKTKWDEQYSVSNDNGNILNDITFLRRKSTINANSD